MDDVEIAEQVREWGDRVLVLDCLVDSPAGSGASMVLHLEGRYFTFDDWNGLSMPYASFDEAAENLPLAIHTEGEWTISGLLAEEVLPRIEVWNLGKDDEPIVVTVNGEEWTVRAGESPRTFIWTGPKAG